MSQPSGGEWNAAIEAAAEMVRTWASDHLVIQSSYSRIVAGIRALKRPDAAPTDQAGVREGWKAATLGGALVATWRQDGESDRVLAGRIDDALAAALTQPPRPPEDARGEAACSHFTGQHAYAQVRGACIHCGPPAAPAVGDAG